MGEFSMIDFTCYLFSLVLLRRMQEPTHVENLEIYVVIYSSMR